MLINLIVVFSQNVFYLIYKTFLAQQISEYEGDEGIGIDLSRTYISEHEEYSSPASSSAANPSVPPPPPQPNNFHNEFNRINNNVTPIYDNPQYYKGIFLYFFKNKKKKKIKSKIIIKRLILKI